MASFWNLYKQGKKVQEEHFQGYEINDLIQRDMFYVRSDIAQRHPELTAMIRQIAKMEVEGGPELRQLKADAKLRKAEAKVLKHRQKLQKAIDKLTEQKDSAPTCLQPPSGV